MWILITIRIWISPSCSCVGRRCPKFFWYVSDVQKKVPKVGKRKFCKKAKNENQDENMDFLFFIRIDRKLSLYMTIFFYHWIVNVGQNQSKCWIIEKIWKSEAESQKSFNLSQKKWEPKARIQFLRSEAMSWKLKLYRKAFQFWYIIEEKINTTQKYWKIEKRTENCASFFQQNSEPNLSSWSFLLETEKLFISFCLYFKIFWFQFIISLVFMSLAKALIFLILSYFSFPCFLKIYL